MALLLLALVLVTVATQVQCESAALMSQKLIADKKGYMKWVVPDDLHVRVGMTYVCAQYDPETHKLTSKVFERYEWVDSRLAWNPKSYGGVDKITYPASEVWTPELYLMDSLAADSDKADVPVVILANGTVHYHVPAVYKTLCKPSVNDPDHVAHCRLRLVEAFIYDAEAAPMDMTAADFDSVFELLACPYLPMNIHHVITHRKYTCCPSPHHTFDVSFDLKERPADDDDRDPDEGLTDAMKDRLKRHSAKVKSCAWPYC